MHAQIYIFTYKTGLLARMAHDLRLHVERFSFTLQGRRIQGYCEADSLLVDGVMVSRTRLDRRTLGSSDCETIEKIIRTELVLSESYPRIEFDAEISGDPTSGKLDVRGDLRLRGLARPLHAELTHQGELWQAAFELKPSEFGIAPYQALAGAIKLQDRIGLQVNIVLKDADAAALLSGAQESVIAPAPDAS
jgi:hypothetical protein